MSQSRGDVTIDGVEARVDPLVAATGLSDLADAALQVLGDAVEAEAKWGELSSTLEGFHAEGYGASDAAAIDPATIMVIVQLVLTLIEKLRKK